MASIPEFYKPLSDISTSQGECLVLGCRVKGNPFPDVIWRREGYVIGDCPGFRVLHKGEIASLVISEAFPEDTGLFACEASNSAGTAITSCRVVVKGGGYLSISTKEPISSLQEKESSQAKSVVGCCITTSSMTSSSASSKCEVNAQKHVSHCHIIPVKPIRHSMKPAMESANVASSSGLSQSDVTLRTITSSCRQSNYSSVSVCKSTKPDENHNFMIEKSQIANQAKKMASASKHSRQEYKVSSFEQRLMNEIEYRLEQIPPINEDPKDAIFEEIPFPQQINPVFVSPLKNFKAKEGSSCMFTCRVSAKPKAKVYWFKDGKQISKRSQHYLIKFDDKGGHELYIPNPLMDDDGNYTAVACNPRGRVSSTGRLAIFYERSSAASNASASTNNLVVMASISGKGELTDDEESAVEKYYRPTFVQKPPPDNRAEEGKLVRFDVKVSGLPAPELEWLINGKRVAQDSFHKVLVRENNVHSFLIERASPMDEGQYTIKASNKAGCVITHIQLHVTPREHTTTPAFIQRLVGQCVADGDAVRLEARAVATPYPKICWKKGADQVIPDKRIHLFEGDNGYVCLQLTQAHLSDAGWYSCSATNAAGIASCNCKLDVYSPVSTAPANRVRIRTPHRYDNLAKVAGVDIRESFSPDPHHAHHLLPESEDL